MIPRFGLTTLRGSLLVANLAILIGLGFLGYDLVFGEDDQLRVSLPAPDGFSVPEDQGTVVDARVLQNLLRIHNAEPPKRNLPPPREAPTLPTVEDGGPLSAFEVAQVMQFQGHRSATLQEKQESAVVAPQPVSARRGSSRSRGRASTRRRTSGRTASARRTVVAGPRKQWVREGSDFKIDGNEYSVLSISLEPQTVVYSDGQREFTLRGDPPELKGLEISDGERPRYVLRGLTDEELGLTPGATPPGGAETPASTDGQGSIQRGGAKAAGDGKAAGRPPPQGMRQPNQPGARPSPQQKPNPRRDLGSTTDVDAARKEAEQRLEELQKNRNLKPEERKGLEEARRALEEGKKDQ